MGAFLIKALILSTLIVLPFMGAGVIVQRVSENVPVPTITQAPFPPFSTSFPTVTPGKPSPIPRRITVKPVPNSDPLVTCVRRPECGGGSTTIPESQCAKQICCQIGNSYVTYPDSASCVAAQGNTAGQQATQINSNEISCDVIGYSKNRNVWTYILTPEECTTARAETSQNTTNPITPYIPPQPPAKSAEEIQRCKDKALTAYQDEKNDCYDVARGYGITSSSWTQLCVQTATSNYDYQRQLCKN